MNMKYIYAMTIGFMLTALSVAIYTAKADAVPDTILEQVTSNVYEVKHPRIGNGTGLWITHNLMLTNCHVAGDDRESLLEAISYDETQHYNMHMVLCDEKTDLAILESDRPNLTILPSRLALKPIPLGKDVFSAGYGMGAGFSLKAGISGVEYDYTRRGVTLPTSGPGDSGSPLYNTKGELVGVLNSGLQHPNGMSLLGKGFFIKLEVVRNYLTGLLSKINRAKGTGQ